MKKYNIVTFTSFTFSYLAKANLLSQSIKKIHPEWHLIALITDSLPDKHTEDIVLNYFDEIVWSKDLKIENFNAWIFKHNIVEACTAVKGSAMRYIFDLYKPDKIIYLDPDIVVFNTLEEIVNLLDRHSIILTPHQLSPEENLQSVRDNEISSLMHGVYNLGFIAVNKSAEAYRFISWWEKRLMNFCFDDIPNGLFTDQKWCDLIPAFFDEVFILKDPGYNVASWNLSNRKLKFDKNGTLLVNGFPLRFYHFTKLGPIGEAMTSRYAKDNIEVYELWEWYKHQIDSLSKDIVMPKDYWFYGKFDDGSEITSEMRKIYRMRNDVEKVFPTPFDHKGFKNWYLDKNNR